MKAPILETTNLDLKIGTTTVCAGLNITLYPGQMLAILGKNGVGKSTLLAALAGLATARLNVNGDIRLAGQRYADLGAPAAARLRGVLLQKQSDPFNASVLETVLSGRHPHLGRWQWESAADKAIALGALAAVGLADFAQRDLWTLSGGERQRVALATLLAQAPPLYLLDEPLAHLDLNHQIAALNLLREKITGEKRAGVMVLHEPGLAWRYADVALLLLGEGRWRYGPVNELLTAETLSPLYGYPLRQIDLPATAESQAQRWFAPV